MITQLLIIYIIGYFVTLFIFFKFKKQLCIDSYDEPKTYVNCDDWSSNAQAYVSWSFGWPLAIVLYSMVLAWRGLMKIARLIEKHTK